MYCNKCGVTLPEGSIFCSKCGAKLSINNNTEAGGYDELDERDRRIKKGFKCLDEENNEKAAKHFLKAIAISPTGDAYFGLACCSSRAKDYDEAINIFNEAKELYEEEGDRQGIKACNNAISEIQSTVKQKKENMDGLLNLGANLIAKLLS